MATHVLTFDKDITIINSGAFANQTKLTSISFPDGITLENNAFQDCINLESVNIPANVTIIGKPFNGCIKLINAPENIDYSEPFYIDVRGTVTLDATAGLQMSTDGETWTDTTATTLSSGKTYFRVATDQSSPLKPNWTEDDNSDYDIGGNINSLVKVNFANDTNCYSFTDMFQNKTKLRNAGNLILPATTLATYCYGYMFCGCTGLTTAPALPATTLASSCYIDMFYGCTSLTAAPILPATILVNGCYQKMFYNCKNIIYVKCLATDISANGCVLGWFNNNLADPNHIPTDGIFVKHPTMENWGNYIPYGWTISNGIILTQNLNVATIKIDGLTPNSGYYTINNGSQVPLNEGTSTIPITQAMNNQILLVHGVFYNEQVQETITLSWVDYSPTITITASNANYITITATNADTIQYRLGSTGEYSPYTEPIHIESDTTIYVIANRTVSGVVYTSEASQSIIYHQVVTEPFYVENITQQNETLVISHNATSDYELYIPVQSSTDGENWTSLGTLNSNARLTVTLAPGDKLYLRANANCWWKEDFEDQWSEVQQAKITGVSKIGGNINSLVYGTSFQGQVEFNNTAANKFKQIFSGNTNLIDASDLKLPATTLTSACYYGMFSGCTSLTTAPELSAATLVSNCYNNMFRNCSNLNYIKCLATNISASGCLSNWTNGVAATGTFVKDANTTWSTGTAGIPTGWTIEDAA